MSRGVENNACVISLNRFYQDSMVGVDAAKPVRTDSIVAVRTGL